MTLQFYNDLSKKIEVFKPINKNKVLIYVCGPTCYSDIHIGNARTFLTFDLLKKYLKYKGYKVVHVQNITDVGHLTEDEARKDKVVAQAEKEHITPLEISKKYSERYFEVLKKLDIEKADFNPKATENIKEILEMAQKLIKLGYAYAVNGSIYFRTRKFKDYGKLCGNILENMYAGARIEVNKEKEDPYDFALWKNASPEHAMKWKSKFGLGYPGWHIECSVMALKHLGKTIDIHGGGKDLIFPHHENEIAQSEAYNKKKFVNYWIHSEFLKINNEKMSKSLGNFLTAEDAIKKWGSNVVRYFLISHHYRTEINITDEAVESKKKELERLQEFILRLKEVKGKKGKDIKKHLAKLKRDFEKHLDLDLNISAALGSLFEFVSETYKLMNKNLLIKKNSDEILKFLKKIDAVLGVLDFKEKKIDQKVLKLIKEREDARKRKDFSTADNIRKELKSLGIIVEDTKEGPRWKLEK